MRLALPRVITVVALTALMLPASTRGAALVGEIEVMSIPQGHTGHTTGQSKPAQKPKAKEPDPKAKGQGHDEHAGHGEQGQAPREPIPPVTDADREAAFPDVQGHSVHDTAIHSFVLFDQLEWQTGGGDSTAAWDTKGWVGGDINRFWFRSEGEGGEGRFESAEVHALYGRAVARWWDLVVGIRQDLRPGAAQTWAALGIQGLAPYWFEVEATAYVGGGGRTHLRLETEYELLLTNRLILQPLVEVEIYGKSDPERHLGRGLSSLETGARVRYEIRRELAPYVGITWSRKFFGTAERARASGESISGARLALGARVWF